MLGDMLRAERERQGLSVKDIEKGTSIRALYIESIENGDFSQLPGEVYTKGFIRNYANFLKMDADAMVKRYMEENHPEKAAAQAEQESVNEEKTVKAEPIKEKTSFATGSDFRDRVEKSHKNQNMLLLAVLVLLVGAGAFYMLNSGSSESPAKTTAPVQNTTSQQAKNTKAEQQASATAETPKKAEGVEIVAKLSDNCWTQVKADGKTIFEGTLQKGKTETWKAKEKLVITAGNAGAIELKINGKESGKMGDRGQVAEKIYTPEGETSAADQSKKDSKK